MRVLISVPVLISACLLIALFWFKTIGNLGEISFNIVSLAVLGFFGSVIFVGLVSLWMLDKHRGFVEGFWLSLWSVITAYVVTDFIAGQFLLENLSPPIVKDEAVHHKLVPGTHSNIVSSDFQYIQMVNQIGLRGKEVEVSKGPNAYRVLMLGDSFTMGKGVQDNETFSDLLERMLVSAEKEVQVLNGGVDSYAPILSYRQLVTNLGPLLKPDLVVLNFDMSDLMQETAYRGISIKGKNGEIIGFRPSAYAEHEKFLKAVKRTISSNFYFSRLLLVYLDRLSFAREDSVTVENMVTMANFELLKHTLADDDIDRTDQWQSIYASILKTREYCENRGIAFLLTTYPWGHQVNNSEWTPGKYSFIKEGYSISDRSIAGLKAFTESNSISFLNTFPAFRSYNAATPIYYDFDMHWTPAGHKIMAEQLYAYISDLLILSHSN